MYTDDNNDLSDVEGFSIVKKELVEKNTSEEHPYDPYNDIASTLDNKVSKENSNTNSENTQKDNVNSDIVTEEELAEQEALLEKNQNQFYEDKLDDSDDEIPEKQKNLADKIEKKNLLLVIGGIIIAIFIVAMFIPNLVPKKKQKISEETESSGQVPGFIEFWEEKTPKEKPIDDKSQVLPEVENIEELENKLKLAAEAEASKNNPPPQNKQQNVGAANVTPRPETNRNEQQKATLRMQLTDNNQQQYAQNQQFPITNYGSANYGQGSYNQSYADNIAQRTKMLSDTMASLAQNQNSQNDGISPSQRNKQSFFTNAQSNNQLKFNTDFSLWSETIIPAVLITGINTDLPGVVIAKVTQNIYSSQNGKYLLIPQGTQLMATYNSSISYGQNRVQIVWNKMIRPDGLEMDLGNLNGVDTKGMSGQKGFVNTHPFQFAKALGLIAVFSILNTKIELNPTNNFYTQNALSDVYKTVNETNQSVINRALDIQPTITIPSGTVVNLITNVTLDIPPYENFNVNKKYVRTK